MEEVELERGRDVGWPSYRTSQDEGTRRCSTGTPSEEDPDEIWQIRAGAATVKTPLVTPTAPQKEGYGFFPVESAQTRFGFTSSGKYEPLSSPMSSSKPKPNTDCDNTNVHRSKVAPGRPKPPKIGDPAQQKHTTTPSDAALQQSSLRVDPPTRSGSTYSEPKDVVITVQPRLGRDSSAVMAGCEVCQRLRTGADPPEIFDDNDPLGDYQVPLVSHEELPYIYTTKGERQATASFVTKAVRPRDRDDDVECRICARKLFAAFFSLGIFVDVGILVWVQVTYPADSKQPWYNYRADYAVAMGLGVFVGVLAYMFVLLELFASPHIKYFYHLKNSLNMDAYFHKLRHAAPRLVLKANNCELHTYRGTSNKVVVRSEKRQLVLTRCVDISPTFASEVFDYGILTKVKMRTSVCFLDEETYARYIELRADAEEAAKEHGNWVEFDHELKVPGFAHKIGVIRRGSSLCRFIYCCCFIFTGLCFISCPYRLWLNCNSNTRQHAIVKAVGL